MQQRGESLSMNKKETIEKKLTASFFKVSTITAAAAVLGVIAIIIISSRYSHALRNFGFAQGDIGKAMFEFADIRSSLRAAIGYDNEEAINTVVKQHEENITQFNEYFAKVEETIQRSWILAPRQTAQNVFRHRKLHLTNWPVYITVFMKSWSHY